MRDVPEHFLHLLPCHWQMEMVVFCFHPLKISWLNGLWLLVRTGPSFPTSYSLNPSTPSTAHPVLSTLQQRNSLLKPYNVSAHKSYCRSSPLVEHLYVSRGLLSSGELCSNECWLGNRMLWWAFCQARQFYCTIWNLSRSQRLSQQSGKSIPAPWLYCARRITANHLSVHAVTSAEVCVGWHRVRVKIFKHDTGEASLREQVDGVWSLKTSPHRVYALDMMRQ